MTLDERIRLIESDDRSHRARLLLLLLAYRTVDAETALDLTRLAYLDYFLRYPASLERVLIYRNQSVSRLNVQPFERESIDGQIGALRIEPWDSEYRRWVAAEFAAGRITATLLPDTSDFTVDLTEGGIAAANILKQSELFSLSFLRALVIAKKLNLKTNTLRSIINSALPETISLLTSAP